MDVHPLKVRREGAGKGGERKKVWRSCTHISFYWKLFRYVVYLGNRIWKIVRLHWPLLPLYRENVGKCDEWRKRQVSIRRISAVSPLITGYGLRNPHLPVSNEEDLPCSRARAREGNGFICLYRGTGSQINDIYFYLFGRNENRDCSRS